MINAILKGVFKIVTKFINILLSPINALIVSFLPGFNDMLSYVTQFFTTASQYVGFITDSLFIDSNVLSFLILYWTFKLTFPLAVYSIKLVVKWYNSLKL